MRNEDDFKPFAAGLSTRVSGLTQVKDGVSLDFQEKKGYAAAALLDIPVVGSYEDAGVSGDLYVTRDGLQSALADMEAGKFNVLIAYDQSRVSWSPEHYPKILRRIHRAGGRLFLISRGGFVRPDDHHQELIDGVQTQVDRFTRKDTRAKVIDGHRESAEEGRQPVRRFHPFGYHIVTKHDVIREVYPRDMDGKYVLIEQEAYWVRQVFDWYVQEGISLTTVAERLTAEGVPTRKGAEWNRTTIYKIITNTVYKGLAHYGKLRRVTDEDRKGTISEKTGLMLTSIYTYEPRPESQVIYIPCPAVVDAATWDAAQARLIENQKRLSGRIDRKYLLSGIAVCPFCGLFMHSTAAMGDKKQYGPFYVCRHDTPKRSPGGVVCSARLYSMKIADRLTAQAIQALVTQPDIIAAAIDTLQDEARRMLDDGEVRAVSDDGVDTAAEAQRKQLERERLALEARRESLVGDTDLDADFLSGALRNLNTRWKEIKAQLVALTAPTVSTGRAGSPDGISVPAQTSTQSRAATALFARQIGDALVRAEAVLMDERVDIKTRWMITRGLVKSVRLIDRHPEKATVRGQAITRPEAIEVEFLPVFEGELTVSRLFGLNRK